jgi:hypothetical protein
MADSSSTPPDRREETGPKPRLVDPCLLEADPSPFALSAAPAPRRGERRIVSQSSDSRDDRTELYLRGPTAYCA